VIRTGQILGSEKENRDMYIYEVQVKEKYQQSGHQRVSDTFLSISGKV
jgi:hypothetical protein